MFGFFKISFSRQTKVNLNQKLNAIKGFLTQREKLTVNIIIRKIQKFLNKGQNIFIMSIYICKHRFLKALFLLRSHFRPKVLQLIEFRSKLRSFKCPSLTADSDSSKQFTLGLKTVSRTIWFGACPLSPSTSPAFFF